jgi:DNA-binding SARP family transcriptional activator
MDTLQIRLFGSFVLQDGDETIQCHAACRAHELLGFLLLNRNRPLSRDKLASLFWGECHTAASKKYLRKTLWQLQNTLDQAGFSAGTRLLDVEQDWITANMQNDIWLDVALFENICLATTNVPGALLTRDQAEELKWAASLYRGDLLEGWYQDWCLLERERLQQMFLATLDKLVEHCTVSGAFEAGVSYGQQVLRYDRAREYTHRELMRLYYLAGDRTSALHQFERCVTALKEEMNIEPMQPTVDLYLEIRDSHSPAVEVLQHNMSCVHPHTNEMPVLTHILEHLCDLQASLGSMQSQIEHEMDLLKHLINQNS